MPTYRSSWTSPFPPSASTTTAHASNHQHGGTDEVATVTAAANAIPKAGGSGTLAIGWIPLGTTSSTACVGDDARLSDDRTASGLRTASTVVSVSSATAPSAGQVLTAVDGTSATWQDASGGTEDTQVAARMLVRH